MTIELSSVEEAMGRAVALDDVGRTADALEELQSALMQFPENAPLHAERARLLVKLGRADEAVAAAETAVSIDPEFGAAHTQRAGALIAAGADPAEAVLAAATGAGLDPGDSAAFMLVRALLEQANRGFRKGYRRSDVDHAEEIAHLIAQEWPTSPLGPLALAMVSLARARRLHYQTVYRWWLLPLLVPVLPVALVWLLVDGIVGSIRRAPHLRDADRYLHAALKLAPDNAYLQSLAGDVLSMRYRWVRAVTYEMGAATLDVDAVDAEEVLGPLARRLTGATVVPFFAWPLTVDLLDGLMSRTAGILMATGLALGTIAGFTAFRHAQIRRLPPRLRPELEARAGPLVAAIAGVALLAWFAAGIWDRPQPQVWFVAAAWTLPVAAVLTAVLLSRFLSARRVVRPGDLGLLEGEKLATAAAGRLKRDTFIAIVGWYVLLAVVLSSITADRTAAVVTACLAGFAMVGLVLVRRRLRGRVPAEVRSVFDAHPGPVIAAGVGTTLTAAGATGVFSQQADAGYARGCLAVAPVAAFFFVRLLRLRHSVLHPAIPLRMLIFPWVVRTATESWAAPRHWAAGDGLMVDFPVTVRLGSPRRRLAACLLDVALLYVTLGVGWLAWALITFRHGQSPGKQLLGLRVVSADTGRPPDYRTMLLRELLAKTLGATMVFTVIGAVLLCWLRWDRCRRQLWDKALHTLVVDDRAQVLKTARSLPIPLSDCLDRTPTHSRCEQD